jgi:hypothetical protein
MLAITEIQLNNIFIGKVRIDSTQIRGEGGWLDPHLIIPIEIALYQSPENQQLVLTGISYSLKLNGNPGTANQIGSSAHLNVVWNMNYRTFQGPFILYLELEGVLARLAGTGNSVDIHQSKPSTLRGEKLPLEFGVYSRANSLWVQVLSGLGYDRVRLVEINLAQMPEAEFVASQFDKARRYLNEGATKNVLRLAAVLRTHGRSG